MNRRIYDAAIRTGTLVSLVWVVLGMLAVGLAGIPREVVVLGAMASGFLASMSATGRVPAMAAYPRTRTHRVTVVRTPHHV